MVKKKKSVGKKTAKKAKYRIVSSKKNATPTGVKVISVLYYLAAVLTLFAGIVLFIGGIIGSGFVSQLGVEAILEYSAESNLIDSYLVPILLGTLILGGILAIAFGILEFFVAKGLMNRKKWARTLALIFSILGFVSALLVLDIISILVHGLIGVYLGFSKKVRKAFNK